MIKILYVLGVPIFFMTKVLYVLGGPICFRRSYIFQDVLYFNMTKVL